MLSSTHRLSSSRAFSETVRRGRRAGAGTVVGHLLVPATDGDRPGGPGCEPSSVRVGLVVGRTVGRAVQRNRVKRRLRHLVRSRLAGLPPGGTLVVRALAGAADRSFDDLARDLDRCLARLGVR